MTEDPPHRHSRFDPIRAARIAAAVIAGWSAFAAFTIAKRYAAWNIPLVEAIGIDAPNVLVWAVVTPPLIYASGLLPVRGPHRLRNALLLTCVTFVAASIPQFVLTEWRHVDWALWSWLRLAVRTYNAVFMGAFVVLASQYLTLSGENAARTHAAAALSAEIARARLRQLRADLHPHFLFNALNAVASLLRDQPEEARRVLRILTELLDRSFRWSEQEIRLSEEVGFAARYLDVQRIRFGRRLSVAIDLPAELEDCRVPPLILQPLVENAVLHGVAPFTSGGEVVVEARGDGEWLHLQVCDSGPGLAALPRDRPAVGIAHVRERLRLVYGERQELRLRQAPAGFTATVTIPLSRMADGGRPR